MKNNFRSIRMLSLSALIASGFIFTSCEKDQDELSPEAAPKSNNNQFANTFTGNCFVVGSFIEGGANETSDYNNIEFAFNSNGTLSATKNGQSASGSWSQTMDDGQHKLNIFFQNVPGILLELNEDWNVQSDVNGVVTLTDVDGPITSTLVLNQVECGSTIGGGGGGGGGSGLDLAGFTNTLRTDDWVASTFILNGQNRINALNNVVFTFNNNNVVSLQRNNNTKNGSYLTRIDDGVLELVMNFTAPPSNVTNLNEDWKVISWNENEIQLADPFDNGNPNSFLTLVRN